MAEEMQRKVWEGVCSAFSELPRDPDAFLGNVWLNSVQRGAMALREAGHTAGGGGIPKAALTSDYALSFVAAMVKPSAWPLKILDLGGGLGTSFLPLPPFLPEGRA